MADHEPTSNAEPVTDEQVAELTSLADLIPPGPAGVDVAAQLMWLVELFVQRGQLARGHHSLIRRVKADHSPLKVHLTQVVDKRSVKVPDIDCASLMHLCRARCCSMDVAMSKEDLDEGRLGWNYEEPYLLRKNPATGYCEKLSPEGGCCVYDDRPAVCRTYDCRNDKRVWEDFEKRIPAEHPFFIVPLGEWDKTE